MEQMMKFFSVFQGTRMGSGEGGPFADSKKGFPPKKAILEEKYFRRVPQFSGDVSKFRSWFFDLVVCVGTVDAELGEELKTFIPRWDKDSKGESPTKWDPSTDLGLNRTLYDKYCGELFGVLVTLTEGEPKSILRGIVESGHQSDGFRGLLYLAARYDRRTQASLLQSYLDVVNPPGIKGAGEVVTGVQR